MANAKKCDRCGMFYEYNTRIHDGDYMVCTKNSSNANHVGFVVDLCNKCSVLLKKFMKNGDTTMVILESDSDEQEGGNS